MRKIILFVLPLILLTVLFLVLVLIFNKDGGKGALQVTSNPASRVFLDGRLVGQTPLCLCELPQMLEVRDWTLKLEPIDPKFSSFEQKIRINSSVLTVVDRTFEDSGSSGSTITLTETGEKQPELLIVTVPNKSDVYLDSNLSGQTPISVKGLTASDHEIKILKDGYREKIIKVRTVEGYKLESIVHLALKKEGEIASKEASTKDEETEEDKNKIKILSTPTGFLRARETPSVSAVQVGQVKPGETFDIEEETDGWYKIKLSTGKSGWISSQYAQKE
ncbi:MAG: PEGA domain-containing protein [Candidatus Levybacteria bacterium]|nr:PEGA domain-containing protein [Candidatus Levybacteria bacterium]